MTLHTDPRPPRRLCAEQRAQARVALASTAGALTGSLWREKFARQGKSCAPQCGRMGDVWLQQTTIPDGALYRGGESAWHVEPRPSAGGTKFAIQPGDFVVTTSKTGRRICLKVIGRIGGAERWAPYMSRYLVEEFKRRDKQ